MNDMDFVNGFAESNASRAVSGWKCLSTGISLVLLSDPLLTVHLREMFSQYDYTLLGGYSYETPIY